MDQFVCFCMSLTKKVNHPDFIYSQNTFLFRFVFNSHHFSDVISLQKSSSQYCYMACTDLSMSRTLLLCVEIIPPVWCFNDYWWSICHLLTNLSLMKCWFCFLHLGTHNSTLLYNYRQLSNLAPSQIRHSIAFAVYILKNACSYPKEVCIYVNEHTCTL